MIYHSVLESERVALRALEPSDVELLYDWENCCDNWWLSSTQTPFSRDSLRRYIKNAATSDIYASRQLRLMIVAKDASQTTIGAIDLFDFDPLHLRAGVGVLITAAHRRKGYAAESLALLSHYCKEVLHLRQLYANITTTNQESITLFQNQNFVPVGVKQQWIRTADGWLDEYLFQKLL